MKYLSTNCPSSESNRVIENLYNQASRTITLKLTASTATRSAQRLFDVLIPRPGMARNYKVSPQTVGLSSVQAFAFKRAGRKASHLTSLLHVRIRYSVQVPTVPPPLTTMTARPTLHPDSAFSSQFSAIARAVPCTYVPVGPYPAISSGARQLQDAIGICYLHCIQCQYGEERVHVRPGIARRRVGDSAAWCGPRVSDSHSRSERPSWGR